MSHAQALRLSQPDGGSSHHGQDSAVLQDILDRLAGVQPSGSGFSARCPAHDDRHSSLSLSVASDGKVLLRCHAGCATAEICKAIGLGLSSLFPGRREDPSRRIVATYDYRDEAGELLFQVVRYQPKAFRQRRPDGRGGWNWKLGDIRRVLYRLPELLAAPTEQTIFIVEGEKDADVLIARGLMATTCPQGAGKWSKLADDTVLNGRHIVVIPDKDKAGRAHAQDVVRRLASRAAEIRVVELPGSGKDVFDWLTAGGTAEELERLTASVTPEKLVEAIHPAIDDPRAQIQLDTDEHRVVSEAVDALGADTSIFQRSGMLVRILRSRLPRDGVHRPLGSAAISPIPPANLREKLSRCIIFTRRSRDEEDVPAHPPSWLVNGIYARGDWQGVRALLGISEVPVLRANGTIHQTPGYDPETGVLYSPLEDAPQIPVEPTRDQCYHAVAELFEVVSDFRFEADEHRSAWLAGLLTPLARFAFDGPSPLFLIDANVRGAGKGLLAQTCAEIVLGRQMPVSSYVHNTEELRKKITAIAIAGDSMVLFDNLQGVFGNDVLDRALTATSWKDRILGRSQEVELPLLAAWYATGNNVQISGDTTRRVVHVRLDVLEERPEDRTEFAHPELLRWIRSNRNRLLARALSILASYCRAGRPSQSLRAFGSFEGWSSLVRSAIVWLGLPDPCLTRNRLIEAADTTGDALLQLIGAVDAYDQHRSGFVVSELLNELYPDRREDAPRDEASICLRAALENLVGGNAGRKPGARQVGNRLRYFRRRVARGVYFDTDPRETRRGGCVWRLHRAHGDGAAATLRVCESDPGPLSAYDL